jgi:hypothetical protein
LQEVLDVDTDRTSAMLHLGTMYLSGDGLPKDTKKGLELLSQAHEKGNVEATCSLGVAYFDGRMVREDKAQGLELLNQAHEKGNADATCSLGLAYLNGDEVERDSAKALELLHQAHEMGIADATYALGLTYMSGDIERDLQKGSEFLRQASMALMAPRTYPNRIANGPAGYRLGCLGLV